MKMPRFAGHFFVKLRFRKRSASELLSCNEANAWAISLPKLTGRIIPPEAEDIEDIHGTSPQSGGCNTRG
jgi:hypothetical protein